MLSRLRRGRGRRVASAECPGPRAMAGLLDRPGKARRSGRAVLPKPNSITSAFCGKYCASYQSGPLPGSSRSANQNSCLRRVRKAVSPYLVGSVRMRYSTSLRSTARTCSRTCLHLMSSASDRGPSCGAASVGTIFTSSYGDRSRRLRPKPFGAGNNRYANLRAKISSKYVGRCRMRACADADGDMVKPS